METILEQVAISNLLQVSNIADTTQMPRSNQMIPILQTDYTDML